MGAAHGRHASRSRRARPARVERRRGGRRAGREARRRRRRSRLRRPRGRGRPPQARSSASSPRPTGASRSRCRCGWRSTSARWRPAAATTSGRCSIAPAGCSPPRTAARCSSRRTRTRRFGVHARLAGEGAWRVPVQGHRQPADMSFSCCWTGFPPTSRPSGSTAYPPRSRPVRSAARCEATSSASRSAAATSASSIARTSPRSGARWRSRSIRPELVNRTAFIRRFEAEAQLVAQLEHPHIVPLYDYWRDPEGAYLVMRWLRGGSLRQALERGPLEPRAGRAPARPGRRGARLRPPAGRRPPRRQAREHPARRGRECLPLRLRHRRPSGRPGERTALAHLVPRVLSRPSSWQVEALTPRSDIYGLGFLTFELLTGQRPPMDAALPSLRTIRPELPAALDEVVACATASDPDERYESVDDSLPRSPLWSGPRWPRRTRPRRTRTRACRHSARQTPPTSMVALRSSASSCRRSATGASSRSSARRGSASRPS